MKRCVKRAQQEEPEGALPDFDSRDVQNIARQKILELLLSTCDTTQEQQHSSGRYHEGDADDRLLGHGRLLGSARPAEERSSDEGHSERNPERDSVIEMIS